MYHSKKDDVNYKLWKNKVTSLINQSKTNYFKNAIDKSKSSKDLWKHVKDLNPKADNNFPSKLEYEGVVYHNPQDIVSMLNSHFSTIADRLINHKDDDKKDFTLLKRFISNKLNPNDKFELQPITVSDVYLHLKKLNVNKSAGTDGVGPRVLKLAADLITPSITFLINKSISSGTFPNKFKHARVTPIHKGGSADIPSNYRPISVLCTVSKIFERHVCSQLYNYLNKSKLLHDTQSGFRMGHSCQTALTRLIDEWLKHLDDGEIVGTVFLDFSKAFDLVNHDILLEKLQCYQIGEQTYTWIQSYLESRTQEVVYRSIKSHKCEIKYGVPQGSILGPLLFLIYVNDLPLHVNQSSLDLYADDSTLHNHEKNLLSLENQIQEDIRERILILMSMLGAFLGDAPSFFL